MSEPQVSIEITNIDGSREAAEAEVQAILASLAGFVSYGFEVDLQPCIYAAILDSPSRWNATVQVKKLT